MTLQMATRSSRPDHHADKETRVATPYLLISLKRIEEAYRRMERCFPMATIYYAVKANPEPEIVGLLARLGCCFDVASPSEVDLCLAAGAPAGHLSYGNTVKKSRDIACAYERGVRLYAFDCEEELEKLAANAPGSRVFCRLATGSQGACWPLSRKFGCSPEATETLLLGASKRGLTPWGIAFHVGSQQMDPKQWRGPIAQTAELFGRLGERGIRLSMVNLGGGFPARYTNGIPELNAYASCIQAALEEHLSPYAPQVMVEPGRGLVGDAGKIVTRVILVSRRDPAGPRWVYLDIGKFGGLAETMDESIRYRIRATSASGPEGPVVLAGPTCDSADILYERTPYRLPLALREDDCLEILSAGAYTSSYASVGFNGFAPLPTYFA